MRELFRRMVFNILPDNTDDHEKNHVLLMDDAQHLLLAPAFDVLPAARGLGYQQLRVGSDGADSTVGNAMSEAALFGLSPRAARAQAAQVAQVCAGWKEHFARAGVTAADIAYLARFIDRNFLRSQRDDLAPKKLGRPKASVRPHHANAGAAVPAGGPAGSSRRRR